MSCRGPGRSHPGQQGHRHCKACDIDAVERIERGICYGLQFPARSIDEDLLALATLLFDRMTETVLYTTARCAALFEEHRACAVSDCAVRGRARRAAQANAGARTGLVDQEIDYLVDSYAGLERDPTDAELMMFAQANSEHCRHKIFNASWVIDGEEQDKRCST